MIALLLALIVSTVGSAPLLFLGKRYQGKGVFILVAEILCWWAIFYGYCPSLVYTFWGVAGVALIVNLIVSAVMIFAVTVRLHFIMILPVVLAVLFIGYSMGGCPCFRASEYASLIGEVDNKNFTTDMQQSDPGHIRLVPRELAAYKADKVLGEAGATIGSQFHVAKKYMTLQRVQGKLVWVAPLDFNGWMIWTKVDGAPGYVKVDAENPNITPVLVDGMKYKYTPNAFFGDNLERYLWINGYMWKGMTEFSFEEDDQNQAWWVVTLFKPTIAFGGRKVVGVAVVNPTNGDIKEYDLKSIPEWIDRVIPRQFAIDYIDGWGEYGKGWWNSWWTKEGVVDATGMDGAGGEEDYVEMVYGADGEPYWFTGITSSSSEDAALLGVMYMHTRTGKVTYYKISGINEDSALDVVSDKAKFQHLHGTVPMLFNFYGKAIWVVTCLGESDTFKGVALVDADTQKLYWDEQNGMGAFQQLRSEVGVDDPLSEMPMTVEGEKVQFEMVRVLRVAREDDTYYLYLENISHVLAGKRALSLKLIFTQPGDFVSGTYIDSGEDLLPLSKFENKDVELFISKKQETARLERTEDVSARQESDESVDFKKRVDNMSPQELKELLEIKKRSEK